MRIVLSTSEIVVLARSLGLSPSGLLGEISQSEEDRLLHEGVRSLIARGLLEYESDPPLLSSDLVDMAGTLLAPKGAVVLMGASEEAAVGWMSVTGDRTAIAVVPKVVGVVEYSVAPLEELKRVLLEAVESALETAVLYELTVVVAGEENPVRRQLTWAGSGDGRIHSVQDDELVELSTDDIASSIIQLLSPLVPV